MEMKRKDTRFIDGWKNACKNREEEIKELALALFDCTPLSISQATNCAVLLHRNGVRVVKK